MARSMMEPEPDMVRAFALLAGVALEQDAAARVAQAIRPVLQGFAPISNTLPFDLEPASFALAQRQRGRK